MKKAAILFLITAAPWAALAQVQQQQLTADQKREIDAALPVRAPAKPRKPRRMLITNLCKRDTSVIRGHPAIPYGNYALEQMGRRTGAYEVVISNDVEMFRPDKIKQFDAVCFNNTQGVLWDDAELKRSLLDFVRGGHGLAALHAGGAATFNQYPKYDFWPEFGKMIGGTDNGGHPWGPTDSFYVKIDDRKSRANAVFEGRGFQLSDEVFQVQEAPLRDHMHVLTSVDMEKTPLPVRVLPVRKEDKDFPLSWIRAEEKGRVFYSGMGHNPQIFRNPALLEHFLAGIQYALGDLKTDDAPSEKPAKRK